MIRPPRALDCAPLPRPLGVRLSDADLRRIEPLQRVLLSPLDHTTIDDWRGAVNRTLVEVFESDAAMFQLHAEGVALQYSDEFDSAPVGKYIQELMPRFAQDRRLYQRAQELKAGNRWSLWAHELEWLYDSEYFNEVVLPMHAFDPLWAAAPADGAPYPAMLHTYHDRRRSRHFFGATDVTLMAVVQPALQAGVRIIKQAASNRASLEALLESRRDGALVYDLNGRLLHRSRSVAGVTEGPRDEESVLSAGRQMVQRLASPDTTDLLHPHNADRTVATRSGAHRLSAVLLGEGVFTLRPAVLVTVAAGERPLPGRRALKERFGLTRRQAEVALLLARRKTNPEIAELLCISEHTVRSHVEAVMGKLWISDRREVETVLRGGGPDEAGGEGERRPRRVG